MWWRFWEKKSIKSMADRFLLDVKRLPSDINTILDIAGNYGFTNAEITSKVIKIVFDDGSVSSVDLQERSGK